MFTENYTPGPRFEVEKVERIGEREVTTRVIVEGLTAEHMAKAIDEALRVGRIAMAEEALE